MNIYDLQNEAHETAVEKGWWDDVDPVKSIPEKLALIHSEISEALEAYRDDQMGYWQTEEGKPEGFGVELADAIIRILDLAGALNISLEYCIESKMEYNKTRPHRHGNRRC
jgi:NTP pyrophosphatase (non-canonical NTP hydrolase)